VFRAFGCCKSQIIRQVVGVRWVRQSVGLVFRVFECCESQMIRQVFGIRQLQFQIISVNGLVMGMGTMGVVGMGAGPTHPTHCETHACG
jgi:hypothetical protein